METVKIINKETKVVKEVKKSLAGDYIGTGKFEVYDEQKRKPQYKINEEEDK